MTDICHCPATAPGCPHLCTINIVTLRLLSYQLVSLFTPEVWHFYAMSYLCKSMKLSFMNTHSQKPNEVENKYLFSIFLDSFCEYAAST